MVPPTATHIGRPDKQESVMFRQTEKAKRMATVATVAMRRLAPAAGQQPAGIPVDVRNHAGCDAPREVPDT